jgi:cell division protein FtsI/penicillin-binding protein 2
MRRHLIVTVLAALCVLTGLTACSRDDGPDPVLSAFLEGWPTGKLDDVGFLTETGGELPASEVVAQTKALSGDLADRPPKVTKAGDTTTSENDATARVTVDWTVAEGVIWQYQTTVRLSRKNDAWRVVWTPATLHKDLKAGDEFTVRTVASKRGGILDGAGGEIVKPRPVVVVGVEPQRITNQASLISSLSSAFASVQVPVSLGDLPARIAAARPDSFVEVVTLRREVYERIRSRIRDLPGTVFQEETLHLAPTRTFARALIGTVDDVRKDQMDASPGKYQIGDQVGQSGLQEQYDDQLRGTPGVTVLITRPAGEGITPAQPEVFRADPKNGLPLRTTLDQKVQNAADAALAAQTKRSALVAVRVSDGAILAVANGPNGGDLNLAFTAEVPPGSTFKMVTTLGLLDANAVGLNTTVNCPKTYTVEGRSFNNSGNFVLGAVPFRVDFAKSCNTAFASLAPKLGPDGLSKAAASVGIGGDWKLGPAVFTGRVASNASAVEAAAAAFGQGTTQVSPVGLAAATAAVARGSWVPPKVLLTDGAAAPEPTSLNAASVTALRTMMREVVTAGTGAALADVPGGPVFAKTGTAEFDDSDKNKTHAWTLGWRGDVAFVVFVENGGTSTATAVPIVEKFLRAL